MGIECTDRETYFHKRMKIKEIYERCYMNKTSVLWMRSGTQIDVL